MPSKKSLKLQSVAVTVAATQAATVAATVAQTSGGSMPSFIVFYCGKVRRKHYGP